MKITKTELVNIILEETRAVIKEGARPGEVSPADLTAAITLAIDEVFQELRPNRQAAALAYDSIAESLDTIFSESFSASERASKLLGYDPSAEQGQGAMIQEGVLNPLDYIKFFCEHKATICKHKGKIKFLIGKTTWIAGMLDSGPGRFMVELGLPESLEEPVKKMIEIVAKNDDGGVELVNECIDILCDPKHANKVEWACNPKGKAGDALFNRVIAPAAKGFNKFLDKLE